MEKCKWCGKKFQPSLFGEKRYCSNKCKFEAEGNSSSNSGGLGNLTVSNDSNGCTSRIKRGCSWIIGIIILIAICGIIAFLIESKDKDKPKPTVDVPEQSVDVPEQLVDTPEQSANIPEQSTLEQDEFQEEIDSPEIDSEEE